MGDYGKDIFKGIGKCLNCGSKHIIATQIREITFHKDAEDPDEIMYYDNSEDLVEDRLEFRCAECESDRIQDGSDLK